MRTFTIVIVTLALTAAIAVGAGLVYMYSGLYNVAAMEPHSALSRWVLQTTMRNSVSAHAEEVGAPPQLSAEQRRHGIEHYKDTCVVCHGAPGMERGELGRGLTPAPPNLAKTVPERSVQELFWIVKHGIKFTGMPAFGPTHNDEELWIIVDFLKRLPAMSPEEYRHMVVENEEKSGSASHSAHRHSDSAHRHSH